MSNEEDWTKKPKAGVGDAGHLAARTLLALIPGVGGATKELFNALIAPPLIRRQAEWIENIAKRLQELEKQVEGFKIENLSSNENFISTIFYATTINIRNHQEEKIKALENAVLNTALSVSIEEDLQHIFLNFIDELTPLHLLVLRYFESPIEWLKNKGLPIPNYTSGGQDSIFRIALPELHKNQELAKLLVTDLASKGLSQDWESLHVGVKERYLTAPRITPIGRQFLRFIRSPLKNPLTFKSSR